MEGRAEVDGDDGVPFLGGEVLDRRHVLDAGIVDQDVDPAEFLGGVCHHGLDLSWLGHVCVVVGGLHPELGADVGVQLLDLLGVAEAVEHDVGALFGQRARDPEPDARGRTGDESRFAT